MDFIIHQFSYRYFKQRNWDSYERRVGRLSQRILIQYSWNKVREKAKNYTKRLKSFHQLCLLHERGEMRVDGQPSELHYVLSSCVRVECSESDKFQS